MKPVKCQSCGFLFVKRAGQAVVCDATMRYAGKRESPETGMTPFCDESAFPIHDEYAAKSPGGSDKGRIFLEVIGSDRVCPKFVRYRRGKTPAEHRELVEEMTESEIQREHELTLLACQERRERESQEWRERVQATHRKELHEHERKMAWDKAIHAAVGAVIASLLTIAVSNCTAKPATEQRVVEKAEGVK